MNDLAWRDATEEGRVSQRIYEELTGPVYEGHAFSIRPPHPECMNCGLSHEEALHTHCKEVEEIPDYCSPKMVLAVEEAIEKRGLENRYLESLIQILGIENRLGNIDRNLQSLEFLWPLIRATPLQKCQAALKAVEKE